MTPLKNFGAPFAFLLFLASSFAGEPATPNDAKRQLPMGVKNIHLRISGKVQGVGFRAFTQDAAKELKLKGWVKNLPTGDVELEAEGPAAAIKKFEDKVKQGPANSRVDNVETLKSEPTEAFTDFEIR